MCIKLLCENKFCDYEIVDVIDQIVTPRILITRIFVKNLTQTLSLRKASEILDSIEIQNRSNDA